MGRLTDGTQLLSHPRPEKEAEICSILTKTGESREQRPDKGWAWHPGTLAQLGASSPGSVSWGGRWTNPPIGCDHAPPKSSPKLQPMQACSFQCHPVWAVPEMSEGLYFRSSLIRLLSERGHDVQVEVDGHIC